MARDRLSALKAATKKAGIYFDGDGLKLVVSKAGAGKWVFRFTMKGAGKPEEMGLGSRDDVSLADARVKADSARRLVAQGVNPKDDRREREAQAKRKTFEEVAKELIESKRAGWRNAKHAAQWEMTLGKAYCSKILQLPVDEIGVEHILDVLRPVWTKKPETASRLRSRIEAVLDAAQALGHIPHDRRNPASWRGSLSHLLPDRSKLARGHHAAMPIKDVPGFVAALREREGVAALALEFTIITAARSGETLGATWNEIDFAEKVWSIPGERMKAGRPHRVPLPARAIEILERLQQIRTSDYVFPGAREKRPLSNMAMELLLRRMKVSDQATTHGFRSSFRDWCGDHAGAPRDLAEAALAHVAGDQTEQAYRRGDALERRRALMDAWAAYIEQTPGSNVVQLSARAS